MSQLTVQQSYLLWCWELLPDRNRNSMGLWYWELMSHPDPAVLPVGTLHPLEWFWVSRRIFIYSHHNTFVLFSKTSDRHQVCPRDNSSPVQARITKFGPKMQNTLVKVLIVLGGNQPWPSRSNLRSKSKFTPFWVCPHHNSSPIQARITKFGPEVQNTLVKVPIVLGGNQLWPSRSNLRSKSKFTPFWVCPHHNSSPIQARITKFGPEVQNTLVKIPVVLGGDWPWPSRSNLT